jgi:hypothetical protein
MRPAGRLPGPTGPRTPPVHQTHGRLEYRGSRQVGFEGSTRRPDIRIIRSRQGRAMFMHEYMHAYMHAYMHVRADVLV